MSDARFILTVNGGGSKTTAAFWTRDGHLLSRAHGAACNLTNPSGLTVIEKLWGEMCGVVGLDVRSGRDKVVISLTVANAGLASARELCRASFAGFAGCYLSTHDYGALVGAFGGGSGAVMVVGRGVSGCRMTTLGGVESFGGWGYPAGDRGGGTWLGMQLISDYLQWRDGTADIPESILWPKLEEVIGTDRGQLLTWLNGAGADEFAIWPPAILEAAGMGDALAVDLVNAAAAELKAFARRLRGDPPLPFQITGQLGRALRPWLAIEEDTARASPHRGALLIGQGEIAPQFED